MKKLRNLLSWQLLVVALGTAIVFLLVPIGLRDRRRFQLFFPQFILTLSVVDFAEGLGIARAGVGIKGYILLFIPAFLGSIPYAFAIVEIYKLLNWKRWPIPSPLRIVLILCYAAGIGAFVVALLMTDFLRSPPRRGPAVPACASNLRQVGIRVHMYTQENQGRLPAGTSSGEVFKMLEKEGYLEDRKLLSCPANPFNVIDLNDPEGVSYYIDPNVPEERHEMRAIMADRPPWELNHGDGVNVLFADYSIRFIKPEDSGPDDKISNPYIREDTDIYSDTGAPYKHAWIRWEREPGRDGKKHKK